MGGKIYGINQKDGIHVGYTVSKRQVGKDDIYSLSPSDELEILKEFSVNKQCSKMEFGMHNVIVVNVTVITIPILKE